MQQRFWYRQIAICLFLFIAASGLRAYQLDQFVTADEAKWVARSGQFWGALLQGDLAGTTVNLTPAVTTTWLGGLGLIAYQALTGFEKPISSAAWLTNLPSYDVDLAVLVATRWPMVIFSSLVIVLIYLLARGVFPDPVPLLGAFLIAVDPHTIALTRIIGHDGLTAIFVMLSLLWLLRSLHTGSRSHAPARERRAGILTPERGNEHGKFSLWGDLGGPSGLILSGAMAGLAFLSKAPAFFLAPFVALVLGWQHLHPSRRSVGKFVQQFGLWAIASYLTFVLVWPAAWIDPIGRPYAVIENAFLSATDQEEADQEGFWQVPDLGLLYYVVYGTFKITPITMFGVGLAVWAILPKGRLQALRVSTQSVLILLLFALLFTAFMTLGDKRSARYILPIFSPLALVAAWGYTQVLGFEQTRPDRFWKPVRSYLIIAGAALLMTLPYAPYFFSYYNPLLGGSWTAPTVLKIGWGEGLDDAARYLDRTDPTSRVGTSYGSTMSGHFSGDLASVTGSRLDYLVLYRKHIQSGQPSPEFLRYFALQPPVHTVYLNGIEYANIYRGPTLTLLDKQYPLLGYRPDRIDAWIGQPLTVDLFWADLPTVLPNLTLHSPDGSSLTIPEVGHIPWGDRWVIQHQTTVPTDTARGTYTLHLNETPLGNLTVRLFDLPQRMKGIRPITFGDQISLQGFRFAPTADYIGLTLAWRAEQDYLPDYTVFAQLLDADRQRVAGFDSQFVRDTWPSSQWVNGEIVVEERYIAIPPDLTEGGYLIIVGLYDPQTDTRLLTDTGQDHWLVPWTYFK